MVHQLKALYDRGVDAPWMECFRSDTPSIATERTENAWYELKQDGPHWLIATGLGVDNVQAREVPLKGVVYIAGPMRGYERFNFPAFDAARDKFIADGFYVFNPADLDRAEGVNENSTDLPPGFMRRAMERDTRVICRSTHIALLKSWEKSSGVQVEAILGNTLKLDFFKEGPNGIFTPVLRQAVCAIIGAHLFKSWNQYMEDVAGIAYVAP